MTIRVIDATLVRRLLPMDECVDAMEAAMLAASTGAVALPPRLITPLIDDTGFLALMPGSSRELNSYGAKVVSLHPGNPARGLPAIQGFVVLFDHDSGAPIAIVEGAELTAIRTAAASGLATRLLARKTAETCGIFGTGVQAAAHIDAMLAVRPVREFRVWGRDTTKAQHFAAQQARRTGKTVRAADDPAQAGGCDLVCTVTGSPEPILKGEWVKPGAHVNLVGAHTLQTREADSSLIAKSLLFTDLNESCRNEGGDYMIPLAEGAIEESQIIGEIGQLLGGGIPGRGDDRQITVYNSLGVVAQDLFAARHVYAKALSTNAVASITL